MMAKNSQDVDVLGKIKEFNKEEQSKESLEKFKQFKDVLKMKLFRHYLKTNYLVKNLLLFMLSFIISNFTSICYFVMILNHIISASIFSLFYPLSIFLYALLENPRPSFFYWVVCIYYTLCIILIKFIIQIKVLPLIINEKGKTTYKEGIQDNLYNYKFGFKYCDSTFSGEFCIYILFDMITLLCLLINRNLLICEGLWNKREHEIENLYQASERIAIYQTKKYKNKSECHKRD